MNQHIGFPPRLLNERKGTIKVLAQLEGLLVLGRNVEIMGDMLWWVGESGSSCHS